MNPTPPPNKREPPPWGTSARVLLIVLVACAALTAAYYLGRSNSPPIEYRIICITGDEVREVYAYHYPPRPITDQEVAAICKDEMP